MAHLKYETSSVGCGCCLCQVLGQHWSATRAHSMSQGLGHAGKSQNFYNHSTPLTASTTSAGETACTRQPRLRPGCRLHAVSSSYVIVVCCPLTPWLRTAMYSPRTALHYSDQGHPGYRHLMRPTQPRRPLIIHIILHAYPTPLQVWSWINTRISPRTGRKTQ